MSNETHVILFGLEYPEIPMVHATRFIINQTATVKCFGKLGKHIGPTDMNIERRLENQELFSMIVNGVVSNTELSSSDCTYVKTLEYEFITLSNMANAMFMCRTTSEVGDYLSDIVTVSVESQGKCIYIL